MANTKQTEGKYEIALRLLKTVVTRFVKDNKALTAGFGISIVLCILHILSIKKEEYFPHAGEWFNLVFQLSVGFIINFIFYLTQVYIPRYKENKEIKKCIKARIESVINKMERIFDVLGKNCMGQPDDKNATEEYFLNLLRSIKKDDSTSILNVMKLKEIGSVRDETYYTVGESITTNIACIEDEIDKIMKYYPQYVNIELMKTLEDILNSMMHKCFARTILQLPRVTLKDIQDDDYLKPYYDLMKRLEVIEV